MWRHFRSCQLGLERIKGEYIAQVNQLRFIARVDEKATRALESYTEMIKRVETLMEEQASEFWSKRITRLEMPKVETPRGESGPAGST
jgi:hypothetical protein